MIEVTLKGKFNTTYGTTLIIETDQVINVGDKVKAEGKNYMVEGFICLSKAKPDDPLSVIAKPIN